MWNRGKQSAVLDLESPADLEAFFRLADGADVLLETFRPGVTARLGLDTETLLGRNPGVVASASPNSPRIRGSRRRPPGARTPTTLTALLVDAFQKRTDPPLSG